MWVVFVHLSHKCNLQHVCLCVWVCEGVCFVSFDPPITELEVFFLKNQLKVVISSFQQLVHFNCDN